MNHEQEALDRAKANQFDAANFHATMFAAQQLRLSNLIAANTTNPKYTTWDANNPPADLYLFDAEIAKGLGLTS